MQCSNYNPKDWILPEQEINIMQLADDIEKIVDMNQKKLRKIASKHGIKKLEVRKLLFEIFIERFTSRIRKNNGKQI